MQRQQKELRQQAEPPIVEGREMGLIEVPMIRRGQGRKEGVLAGGKGQPVDIPRHDGLAVQRHNALVAQIAQNTLHHRGLSGAVLPQQPHDLPLRDGQRHIRQGLLVPIFLCYMRNFQHNGSLLQLHIPNNPWPRVCAGVMRRQAAQHSTDSAAAAAIQATIHRSGTVHT